MNWQEILYIVVTSVVGIALPPLSLMFLNWLKTQKWVAKLHLENFFGAMVPQVVQWVEYWAEQLPHPPSSEEKMAKFVSLLKQELPTSVKMTDEEFAVRAEIELKKLKAAGIGNGDVDV